MKKVPEGYHTITPSITVDGAASAIQLYEQAFGAQELYRLEYPNKPGKIMHACIQIGTSRLFLSDVMPGMAISPSTTSFYLYLENVDGAFARAKNAGLAEAAPLQDMFWGDRTGTFRDKFGIGWTLASHVRDVSPEELEKGARQFISKAA